MLTREQVKALEANKDKFDKDIQDKITKGVKEYDEKLAQANKKATKEYNHTSTQSEKRSNNLQALGMTEVDATAYEASLEKTYGISAKYAKAIAEENYAAQVATKKFYDTFDKYGDSLNSGAEGTIEYSKGVAELQKAYENWMGVEIDYETTVTHLQDFKDAINGDKDAIEALRKVALENILVNLQLKEDDLTDLKNTINSLEQKEIGIGVSMDDKTVKEFLTKLNSLVKKGKISAEQAMAIAKNQGWVVEGGDGLSEDKTSLEGSEFIYRGTTENLGTDFTSDDTEEKERSKQKAIKDTIETIEKERDALFEEKEVTDQLSKQYKRISTLKDQAYGAKKLAYSKQERANLEAQVKQNEKLIKGYEKLANAKEKSLKSEFGAKFDVNGNMTNYEEILETLGNNVIAAKKSGDDAAYDSAKDTYDRFKELYEDYNNYRDSQFDALYLQALHQQFQVLIQEHNQFHQACFE